MWSHGEPVKEPNVSLECAPFSETVCKVDSAEKGTRGGIHVQFTMRPAPHLLRRQPFLALNSVCARFPTVLITSAKRGIQVHALESPGPSPEQRTITTSNSGPESMHKIIACHSDLQMYLLPFRGHQVARVMASCAFVVLSLLARPSENHTATTLMTRTHSVCHIRSLSCSPVLLVVTG